MSFVSSLRSELPHSPRNLQAGLNATDSRSVDLSWVRPFDGNSPLLHYIVELSENSECPRKKQCLINNASEGFGVSPGNRSSLPPNAIRSGVWQF